jgi:hypothetical protein
VIGHIFIGLGIAAGYVLFALAHPVGRCWRCGGKRVTGRKSRRGPQCRVCKGHGLAVTPGATAVHRLFWLAFGDRIRARMQQRNADLLESRKEAGQ